MGLFGSRELAEDANLPDGPRAPFGGVTLAINVEIEEEEQAAIDAAVAAGGTQLKPATRAEWGGLSGYFADPDGHPWEVAWNPGFAFRPNGTLDLP